MHLLIKNNWMGWRRKSAFRATVKTLHAQKPVKLLKMLRSAIRGELKTQNANMMKAWKRGGPRWLLFFFLQNLQFYGYADIVISAKWTCLGSSCSCLNKELHLFQSLYYKQRIALMLLQSITSRRHRCHWKEIHRPQWSEKCLSFKCYELQGKACKLRHIL